jgi:thiosulfate/3-mercaptopyruvate sulfurtransferase
MEARSFRLLFVAIAAVGIAFAAAADNSGQTAAEDPLIVDPAWVAARLGSADVAVVEVATPAAQYQAGHIPGAAYLERRAIYDTVNGVPGMFPGVDTAVDAFERLGISNNTTVVLYDEANSLWAARAFWALDYLGHGNVHVLNGGLAAWKAEGRPLSKAVPHPARGHFAARVQPDRIATESYVLANYKNPDVTIVDARSRAEYAGSDVRAARGGHIPGAVNVDWQQAATDDKRKLFLDEQELSEMYDAAGVTAGKTTVVHCQTGVRAAHTYLVLRSLGYKNVRLYDGSWEQWGNDASTPVVKGAK